MKKLIFTLLLLLLSTDLATAYNSPRDMADVVGRNLGSKGSDWLEKKGYGHVGIYSSRKNMVLDVSDRHTGKVIQFTETSDFTSTRKKYWGATYGIGHRGQHNNAIRYGWRQKLYTPHYTGAPLYREGKWKQKWYLSKWRWKKKWYKSRGWFRCDTFVRYCYRKATGVRLGGSNTRSVRPLKVHRALPYRR